jgi:predicted component of type VI protein secretion system
LKQKLPSVSVHRKAPSVSSSFQATSVRNLTLLLEQLTNLSRRKERIFQDFKLISQSDDISESILNELSKILNTKKDNKLVKPEDFEKVFERGLKKYEELERRMENYELEIDERLEQVKVRQ